jgi:hypothetical protein
MTPKPVDFDKLKAFKGSVLKNLKIPDTYRGYSATCRKIIRLYMRLHYSQIFLPELVNSVKQVAAALKYIGLTRFKDKIPDNLIEYLDGIINADIKRWLTMAHNLNFRDDTEVIVEESREKIVGNHCNFCKVELHYPAFVIHRTAAEIVHKSLPIGIKCLRSQQGKLATFLNAPQIVAVLFEMRNELVNA